MCISALEQVLKRRSCAFSDNAVFPYCSQHVNMAKTKHLGLIQPPTKYIECLLEMFNLEGVHMLLLLWIRKEFQTARFVFCFCFSTSSRLASTWMGSDWGERPSEDNSTAFRFS